MQHSVNMNRLPQPKGAIIPISGIFTRRSSGQQRVLNLDESLSLVIFDEGLYRLQFV